ncbi:MAG: hypothetical protein CR991_01145 [Proteobacteria bacterium]|nr:MAG: hypothetical protein CR991_01145 [Pseudomonadota bacterium]
MKKLSSAVLSTILLSLYLTPAHAGGGNNGAYLQNWGVSPQTRFYGGAGLGMASQDQFDDGNAAFGRIYGGVRFNHLFSAEVGYLGLGEVESDTMDGRNPATLKSDSRALYAAGLAYMPVSSNLELMGKAGVLKWDQDNTKHVERVDISSHSNDDGVSPLIGLGAQYWINPNIQTRVELEHIFGMGEADDYETDVNMLSAGLNFSTY